MQYSRFDRQSIMLYAVDNALTIGDWSVGWNTSLSDEDKVFIGSQYPGARRPEPQVQLDGAAVDGSIGADGEVDLYRFRIAASGRYIVRTTGKTDIVMSLHGPNNDATLVAVDDDSGYGLNARIDRDLTPGEYLVQVRHYRPSGTGGYSLALTSAGNA
jgi:hypothetical protein